MKRLHLLSTFCFAFVSFGLVAQTEMDYTQSLSNPSNLFPELTGWHGGMQINTGYRNQWPGIPATYTGYVVGADAYVHSIRSGVGIMANHIRSGLGGTYTNTIDLNVAPKIELGDQTTLMPAVSLQVGQISNDWTQIGSNPAYPPLQHSVNYLSLGAGIALVSGQSFFAAHSDNINQPNVSSFPNTESRIPRTYQFLAGRNFEVGSFTLTPNVSYQRFGEFSNLNLALNAQYKSVYIGSRFAYNDAIGFAAGYEVKQRVRLSYCYDMNVSRLATQTIGSHEVALRIWLFKDRAKRQFLSNLSLI